MSDDTQAFHLGTDGRGSDGSANVASTEGGSFGSTLFFDETQGEAVVGLSSLDPQVRPDGDQAGGRGFVSDLPSVEGFPVGDAGVGDIPIAAKGLLEQVDSLGSHLPDGDSLGIHGSAGVTADAHGIGAALDADGAIGVDDTGQVGEDQGVHNDTLSGGGVTTPFYKDDWLTIYGGDARKVLAGLEANSIDCIVTSPPYLLGAQGLRDGDVERRG